MDRGYITMTHRKITKQNVYILVSFSIFLKNKKNLSEKVLIRSFSFELMQTFYKQENFFFTGHIAP